MEQYLWIFVGMALILMLVFKLYVSKLETVKAWLLLAVTQAEKELGGNTGQLKLRFAFDLFLDKFPWLAPFVPFSIFSTLVDEVLDDMKAMLNDNPAVASLVKGGSNECRPMTK